MRPVTVEALSANLRERLLHLCLRHVPKKVADIDHAFLQELSKYFRSNKLTGLLALGVLEDTSSQQPQMREFVLAGQGTVLVKEDRGVANTDIYRVTGWSFAQDRDGTVASATK